MKGQKRNAPRGARGIFANGRRNLNGDYTKATRALATLSPSPPLLSLSLIPRHSRPFTAAVYPSKRERDIGRLSRYDRLSPPPPPPAPFSFDAGHCHALTESTRSREKLAKGRRKVPPGHDAGFRRRFVERLGFPSRRRAARRRERISLVRVIRAITIIPLHALTCPCFVLSRTYPRDPTSLSPPRHRMRAKPRR